MAQVIALLDEVKDQDARKFLLLERPTEAVDAHDCDGCGHAKADVDLYAENSETGETLWLCLECGDW